MLWMLLIFIGSTDVLSGQRTSRFLGPLLHWLKPDLSAAAVERVQFVIRKCGHMTEYAVLAILIRGALQAGSGLTAPWERRGAIRAFGLAVLYAVSDEIHQGFVSTRFGSGWDVLIDATGAAVGLTLIFLWLRRERQPAGALELHRTR